MIGPRHLLHLTRRFFGSLDTRPPPTVDRAWTYKHLSAAERQIWAEMSNPDQRHSIEVARAVASRLVVDGVDDRLHRSGIAAALLHDSGKTVSGLGTFARVAATLVGVLAGPGLVRRWRQTGGTRRRMADYWRHPEIGGARLSQSGSEPLVSTWAAEHHKPESTWTIDPRIGRILRDCDDD